MWTHTTRLIASAVMLFSPGLLEAVAADPVPATPPPAQAAVASFSPQGTAKELRQVAARFATPMVALGDPRLADPFIADCAAPGKGRWVDSRTWVYDFDADVPGGLRCRFTLKRGVMDLAGKTVTAARAFSFDTGGPAIVDSMPGEGSDEVPVTLTLHTTNYNDDAGRLRADVRAAATASGVDLSKYDFDVTSVGGSPSFTIACLAYVGAPGAWLANNYFGTATAGQELGHNLGAPLANYWDTGGASAIGPGDNV